jgi:L-fuconolactonase
MEGDQAAMANIDSIEIIDAQIHEPTAQIPIPGVDAATTSAIDVELAREAMDAIGVDIALAVTGEPFITAALERYPDRFAGVVTFDHAHPDLSADVARVRDLPGVIAGRALVGDWRDMTLRPEFEQGLFDPIFAAAEEVGLPIFVSTHGWAKVMEAVVVRHPGLTLIIDHIGVSQHPVSPPNDDPWGRFPDLLALAKYPNVHVKLCGAPLLSEQAYPFSDVWPQLALLFESFGFDRIMWGSDYTRMRQADLPRGTRPRRRGLSYADSLSYLLDSDRFTQGEKEKLFGGTLRRVLNWPRT